MSSAFNPPIWRKDRGSEFPFSFLVKLVILFSAFFGFIPSLRAQTTEPTPARPEPPAGELLRAPGNFSKWEIVSTFPEDKQKKTKASSKTKTARLGSNPHTRRLVTTKTGPIIHEERFKDAQPVTETWFDNGTQYRKFPGRSLWYVSDAATTDKETDTKYDPLPNIGYRDIDIVKPENYLGTVSYENRRCLVFAPGGSKTIGLNKAGDMQKKLNALESVAYVEEESRLPVEVRTLAERRVFQFDPPPTEKQTLPTDLVTQIQRGEDGRIHLHQPSGRPY